MVPWVLLGSAAVPGEKKEIELYRRGQEFAIRVEARELMNSRLHGSEEALADLACARIAGRSQARVLVGGLGMGYTVAAALGHLQSDARVIVAELLPIVVSWNRGPLADLAGRPLEDPRVAVEETDVARLIRKVKGAYDGILLDVDNGPRGLVRTGNDWLYTIAGLRAAAEALRPRGVLAVWSAGPDSAFTKRLRRAGFEVEETTARARGLRKGPRHTVWVAQVPAGGEMGRCRRG